MNSFRIAKFKRLDSTNKYMKENLDKLSVFDVVTADVQINGYGRMQRNWFDNTDNLSFSLFLELPLNERNGILTQITALAVMDVISKYTKNASIKWPNDCLVNEKKIAGILIENIIQGNVVKMIIGVGVNINNRQFDSSIEDKATSLFLETGTTVDKDVILKEILTTFKGYFNQFIENDLTFMERIRSRSSVIGKFVTLFEGNTVYVKDIDSMGRLIVWEDGKEYSYVGSEISLTKNYK